MDVVEQKLWDLLSRIHNEVNRLAQMEADAAPIGGIAATGILQPSKDALVKRAEQVLDALERIHADRT